MKRAASTLLVVAALVAAAALLNPSAERHRQKIRQAMGERSPIAGMLGLGTLKAFASNYRSLGVASYTTAGDRVASVGAFGFVYVLQ
ncbi:hypothetical protein [Ramlibacter alkalitolerans]|jgi:hypothetical protein|uniref:DUF4359 domain-containing protein n=1 Tax=Ramlibacter alkalitolerans TaxID=2039631 RepID=A0ABS1JH75_9BURK|nr:hypothetical protein [Ramlibacter alkalitolerans]MBL0423574.1 hypothetical protein [Ramlibacter alkalitolerans]